MKNRILYLSSFLLFFVACTSNPLEVDVSGVEYDLGYINVVSAYQSANSLEELAKVNAELNENYGELYEYYTAEMLRVGMPLQDSTTAFLNKFIEDTTMSLVNTKIAKKFDGFEIEVNDAINMFKHLKYHLPNAMLPNAILTYNSTFTNGVISTPNFMGIGLEMYLGAEDDIVQKVPFPQYFKAKMNPDFLLPDMAQSWLESNVLEGATEESFLANLIYFGKVLYAVKAMLPKTPNHLILRYYEDELKWAEENEYPVWQYIVQENLVYDTQMKTMMRYFKPAPSTIGFDGSPDRIGQYLGFKIVSAYMQKNSEVTVKELMAEKNHSKILKSYKPTD